MRSRALDYNTPTLKKKQKLIVIVGPTSSGKSSLAIEIAKQFDGEVISADSRQVYKGLDIGTGKVTEREKRGVKHHMLDVVAPKRTFTAHYFVVEAQKAINDVVSRRKISIMCGGTGFYIDALLGRIQLSQVAANSKLRAQLDKKSAADLFAQLAKIDPNRASNIDRNNKRRLIRALEIAKSKSTRPGRLNLPGFDCLWIGLKTTPKDLRSRINARLHKRLRHGMVAEAKRLHAGGLSYKRMHELGLEYRSLARLLKGETSRAALEDELQKAIWQYSRRQMTYWRRNKDIQWFHPKKGRRIAQIVAKWLN